ncbi:MAG: Sec-independent protein translocase protein TatB [Nitrincola lacisaponensis]|uniref:Sec-independent protein translocase protein TatB n=1 Tax=Nitrincola lacisaponensis TaxID=267850 RepID=A0A063Y2H7_9GAMM|nr:Sec-independent protein translocase protein TatB [Nitrincola lacisaponensis]KDE38742.1 Twin-arginine translocation protein TatB [Nitrincola lacisaponensis]
MFDIGFAEILIVSVVALLVLGPDKLPVAVKTCGMWIGRIKRSVTAIQHEISEELRVEELRRTTAISKEELEKELSEMRKPFKAAAKDVESAVADPNTASGTAPKGEASSNTDSDKSST